MLRDLAGPLSPRGVRGIRLGTGTWGMYNPGAAGTACDSRAERGIPGTRLTPGVTHFSVNYLANEASTATGGLCCPEPSSGLCHCSCSHAGAPDPRGGVPR